MVFTEKPQTEVSEETVIPVKPEEVEKEVFEAPRFITTLQKHVDVEEGTSITLTCVVTGNPRPEVTWFMVSELSQEYKKLLLTHALIQFFKPL